MLNSYYWNNLYIFAVVMKIKILIFCLIVSLTARAYNDHRNAKVDSLEALLKSKNPPKGDDLLSNTNTDERRYRFHHRKRQACHRCRDIVPAPNEGPDFDVNRFPGNAGRRSIRHKDEHEKKS